ncbi:MAG: hypothetical protein ACOC8X_03940 [Chloroflexota bacterium]
MALRTLGILLIALALLIPLTTPATGAGREEWSGPYLLNNTEYRLASLSAAMVADPYGNAHIFWIESRGRLTNAILYSRYDGRTWTRPLELFVNEPGQPIADFVTASIDHNNRIHLTWLGGAIGPVLTTSAQASQTLSSLEWEEPQRIEVSAHRFRLFVDSDNKQHLIFTAGYNYQPGVHYVSSTDNWLTMSQPLWLNPEMPQAFTHDNMQAYMDAEERIHIVWSEKEIVPQTRGGAIMYLRSVDRGVTWEPLETIDSSDGEVLLDNSDPSLAVSGDDVHVIWAGGDSLQYRNHRYSADGGQTWSPVIRRNFGQLHGQAQGDAVVVDAAGQIHFVGHVRWPEGMYHITWRDDEWTRPSLFYLNRLGSDDSKAGTINAHGVRAVVRTGNELVVTFYDRADDELLLPAYGLYAMSYELSEVSPLSTAPTPTPTLAAAGDDVPAASTVAPASPTPTPSWAAETPPSGNGGSPSSLILAGILPALLIIVAIAFIRITMRGPLL